MSIGGGILGRKFGFQSSGKSSLLSGLYAAYNYESDASDSSGNGYNGTQVNVPTYVAGKFLNCVKFNTTNYIYSGANSDFNFGSGDFAVSLWINPALLSVVKYLIIKGNGFGGVNDAYFMNTSALDKVSFSLQTNISFYSITTTSSITGTWQNIIAQRVGNTIEIYFNGTLEASAAVAGSTATYANAHPYYHTLNVLGFDGKYDSHNIWSRSLTSVEIVTIQTAQYPF